MRGAGGGRGEGLFGVYDYGGEGEGGVEVGGGDWVVSLTLSRWWEGGGEGLGGWKEVRWGLFGTVCTIQSHENQPFQSGLRFEHLPFSISKS